MRRCFADFSDDRRLSGSSIEGLNNVRLIQTDIIFWEVSPGSVKNIFCFFTLSIRIYYTR